MVTRTDSLSGDVDVVGTSSRSRNTPETGRDGGRLVPTLRPGSVDGEEIRVREISFSHGVDSGLAGGETSSLGRMDTLSNHLESGLTLHADKPSSSPRNSVSAGEEISTRGRMDTLSDRPEGDLPPRADSTLRSPRNSIVVPMEVNDTAVDVVLDTASQVTVVSEEFAEHLKLTGVQGASLQGAARTGKMRSRIVHGVKLRFGDVECAWDIYVAPITDDVLLGLDFLEKHRAIVDLEQGVVVLGDQLFPLQLREGSGVPCRTARLMATESVKVGPGMVAAVPCRLEGDVEAADVLLFEPDCSDGPMDLPVLLEAAERVYVPAVNSTGSIKAIIRGQTLGVATAVELMDPSVPDASVRRHTVEQACSKPDKVPEYLQSLFDASTSGLTEKQAERLAQLLINYQDIFSKTDQDLGHTAVIQHRIDTRDAAPIKQRMRRTPVGFSQEEEKHLQSMLTNGIIRPSASEWASPPVLIRKRDGSVRWCVDYRKLNTVTVKDVFPLPLIEECLDTLSGSCLFSTLDMCSGYWQIEIAECDRPKTAFITRYGLFEHNRMAFGLCNAPATFQRAMQVIFHDMLWKTVLAYLDDVIVLGTDFQSHLANLEEVFQRLRAHCLKLKPRKCALFQERVQFLGRLVSGSGVEPDPDKIKKIRDWPVPQNTKDVRSFLGLANYHREHIRGYAGIASPLYELTSGASDFNWSPEHHEAFKKLKEALTSAPILSYPRDEGNFILDTDASDLAIGAELSQEQDGTLRVIAYASFALTSSQRNYCTTRKELLAVVRFTRHFRHYLLGRQFTVRTDHHSLAWLMRFKQPQGQLARWLEELSQFDFVLIHRPGKKHQNADGLSRIPTKVACDCYRAGQELESLPCGGCDYCGRAHEQWRRFEEEVDNVVPLAMRQITVTGYTSEEMREEQLKDPDLRTVIGWLNGNPDPLELSTASSEAKHLWKHRVDLMIEDGVLRYRWHGVDESPKLVLPRSLRQEALRLHHDVPLAGHYSTEKTLEKLRRTMFWPGMRQDCEIYVQGCPECGRNKQYGTRARGPLGVYHAGFPLERVHIDILGPFPKSRSGNAYVLVLIDQFSKWLECYALPDQTAKTVAQTIVNEFVARFGVPLQIHADQGPNFEGELFQTMCGLLGISKTRTTPYRPRSNGQVERMNRTILQMIRCFLTEGQDTWDESLSLLAGAVRATPSSTTGFSPNLLMLGREVFSPADLTFALPEPDAKSPPEFVRHLQERLKTVHELARSRLKAVQRYQKRHYDLKTRITQYNVGDLVYCLKSAHKVGQSKKLNPVWQGPHLVTEVISPLLLRIQDRRREQVVHHDRLKPYRERTIPFWIRRQRQRLLLGQPLQTQDVLRTKPDREDPLQDIRHLFRQRKDKPEKVPTTGAVTKRGRQTARPHHLADYVC